MKEAFDVRIGNLRIYMLEGHIPLITFKSNKLRLI